MGYRFRQEKTALPPRVTPPRAFESLFRSPTPKPQPPFRNPIESLTAPQQRGIPIRTAAIVSPASPSRLLSSTLIHWHLLSLDAPTVATLWTLFLAHTAHFVLPPTIPAATFLAVWIIYATDRLLDSRKPDPTEPLYPRHHFHHRHRRPFLLAITLASIALIPLLLTLPPETLRLYFLLAAALLAWFSLIHFTQLPLPKELAVGPFFAAAAAIPTHHLTPLTLLFAALCTLNCLLLQTWETPRHQPFLQRFTLALIVAAALLHQPAPALAAALLLALHHFRPQDPTLLRALADLALLTPTVFLL